MHIMNNTNAIHNKNISLIQKYQLDQIINAKQMLSRLVADMKYIYGRVGGILGKVALLHGNIYFKDLWHQ